jgi:uncharacterized protein (TIRG00374 family)
MIEVDKRALSQAKRGLKIFLIITVISVTGILAFTAKKETFSSLRQASPFFLCLALGTCLFRMYLECLRLQTLSWAFGKWLDFKSSAEFTIGGYFLSLSPFGAGGLPLQFYILKRKKFSFGESGAIIGMRGITSLAGFALWIPMLVGFSALFAGSGMKMLSRYLAVIYGLFLVTFVLVMLRTNQIKRLLSRLQRFFACRGKGRIAGWVGKSGDSIDSFKVGLKRCWGKGIYKLVLTILLASVSLFVYALIAPLVFRGLGVNAPVMKTAVIQFILTFLLMFAPTPGGSGIAEGAGLALFRGVCDRPELLGIFVISWRFFTYYVGVILGGLIILKMLVGRKKKGDQCTMVN